MRFNSDCKSRTESNTERVDVAIVLLCHASHAANSLADIALDANTFNEVRALDSQDEKVSRKVANDGYV